MTMGDGYEHKSKQSSKNKPSSPLRLKNPASGHLLKLPSESREAESHHTLRLSPIQRAVDEIMIKQAKRAGRDADSTGRRGEAWVPLTSPKARPRTRRKSGFVREVLCGGGAPSLDFSNLPKLPRVGSKEQPKIITVGLPPGEEIKRDEHLAEMYIGSDV